MEIKQDQGVAARLGLAIKRREEYLNHRQRQGYATKNDREMQEDLEAMRSALSSLLQEQPSSPDPVLLPAVKSTFSFEQASIPLSYSPLDPKNPFRLFALYPDLFLEKFRAIAKSHPFSIRMNHGGGWFEWGRFSNARNALLTARALVLTNQVQKNLVIIKCSRVGKEGREKPCYYYPSEQEILVSAGIETPELSPVDVEEELLKVALVHLSGLHPSILNRSLILAKLSSDSTYKITPKPGKDRQWLVTIGKNWVLLGSRHERITYENLNILDSKRK